VVADAPTRNPRGPYAKTSKQREAIIQAALECFGQHGYHGASMREIARQVGLSQAGLLHHFDTKADLLTATLESRDTLSVATGTAAATQAQDALAGLIAVVEDNASQRPLVQMFTAVSAEATDVSHPAHAYFRQRSQFVIDLMRSGLEHAVEQGLVRTDLDLDEAARQCQAMMYGLQVQWLFDPSVDMVATFRHFLEGFTRT
jgi:AcrR family transcriptional regulator